MAFIAAMGLELLGYLLTALVPLAICVLVECLSPKTAYRLRDRLPGAVFMLALPLTQWFLLPVLGAAWRDLGIGPLFTMPAMPAWAEILVVVAAMDCMSYWQHRFEHRFFWPVHAVHHSPTEVHAANAFGHPLQALPDFLFGVVALSFIQFGSQKLPVAAGFILGVQSVIIHSPLRVHLGPLRYIFVDHRSHRIHHSREERHFGKNFGILFSLWDQLFGTAYFPKPDEWPATGVDGHPPPRNVIQFLLHPVRHFRAAELMAGKRTR